MKLDTLPTVVLGLVGWILTAALVTLGLHASGGAFADTYELVAEFNRVGQGIDQYSTVKVRGVTVGAVDGVALRPDGRVEITLRIDSVHRIADTGVARIEPLSVFGPKAIVIEPGANEATGPFLGDQDAIGTIDVGSELTEVAAILGEWLEAVDPEDVMTVVGTAADALDGMGETLASGLDNASELASLGGRHSQEIREILAGLADLSRALDGRGSDVAAIARDAADFLADLSPRGDELDAVLRAVSGFSGRAADLLDEHGESVGEFIEGLPTILDPIAENIDLLDDLVLALDELLGTLGTRLLRDGGEGRQFGVLKGEIPADICDLILGLPGCPEGGLT